MHVCTAQESLVCTCLSVCACPSIVWLVFVCFRVHVSVYLKCVFLRASISAGMRVLPSERCMAVDGA